MHSKGYPMIKSYYTECIISIHKRRSKQTNDNSYVHQILYFKLQEKKICFCIITAAIDLSFRLEVDQVRNELFV